MNTEYFIAKKLISQKVEKNKISRPIVSIATASIIIGLAVMLITVSVVTEFQNQIREKVIGFGSHIQVTNLEDNTSMESTPIFVDSNFVKTINSNPNITHVQSFILKPGILQSRIDTTIIKIKNLIDTAVNRDILGVLFKGIGDDFDWDFFTNKIIDGEVLNLHSDQLEVLISKKIAQTLHYKVGDKINAFFILNNGPKKRIFTIKGIYDSGLEEFDKKMIFTNINHLKAVNNWGIKSTLTLADTCINNQFVLKGNSYSNFPYKRYKWNGINSNHTYYLIDSTSSIITFEAGLNKNNITSASSIELNLYDKSTAHIQFDSACNCTESLLTDLYISYPSDSIIITPFGQIKILNGVGTQKNYIGGYELLVSNWEDLNKIDEIIYESIPFELKTTKITDLFKEIFSWLSFLDMNIIVILSMMLAVSIINMITSILVLILEKTNLIGILKAIGATDWSIRKIFIYNSLFILGKGLLWGNIIGIAFLLIQHYFKIIPLDVNIYYLDYVPVNINLINILLINALTILICAIVLILPSYLIAKIRPIKAIKFN